MKYEAKSPEEYIKLLPEERQVPFQKLREIILKNLPEGFEETISCGTIGYVVPHSIYPNGYHCNPKLPLPFINIASQKNFIALYHMGIYANKKLFDWFVSEFSKHSNLKLDMGKSCIRFKNINQIPYELLEKLVSKISPTKWIEIYEKNYKK